MRMGWMILLLMCGNVYSESNQRGIQKRLDMMIGKAERDLEIVDLPAPKAHLSHEKVRRRFFHSFPRTTETWERRAKGKPNRSRIGPSYRCKKCYTYLATPGSYFKHWAKNHWRNDVEKQ